MVYDDTHVTILKQGIPCKVSNVTSKTVTLGINTHIAWVQPLIEPSSIPVCSTINDNSYGEISRSRLEFLDFRPEILDLDSNL